MTSPSPSPSPPADPAELWSVAGAVGDDLERCVRRLGDPNAPWTESDAEQVDALVMVIDDLRARAGPPTNGDSGDQHSPLAALYEAPLAVGGLVPVLDDLERRARRAREQAWERAGRPIPMFVGPSPVLAREVKIEPVEVGLVDVPLEGPEDAVDEAPAAGDDDAAIDGTAPDDTPHRAVDRSAVAVEVLTVVGVLMLVFVVFAVWGSGLLAAQSQRSLEREFSAELRASVALGSGTEEQDSGLLGGPTTETDGEAVEDDAEAESTPTIPSPGEPVAILDLPTIGSRQVVVAGTRASDLRAGPGHLRSTPQPGRAGNAVVFGRRTTFGRPFTDLDELRPGDPMDVVTTEGAFRYVVQEVRIVGPGDPDPIGPTFSNRLTLVTSDSEYSTAARLVAIGLLDGAPVPTPVDDEGQTAQVPLTKADELGTRRTSVDWAWAIILTQALVAAYFGTKWLYRHWLPWSTWLVSTPVFLLVALTWLDSLARLLPSVL